MLKGRFYIQPDTTCKSHFIQASETYKKTVVLVYVTHNAKISRRKKAATEFRVMEINKSTKTA